MASLLVEVSKTEGARIVKLHYHFVSREIIREVNIRHLNHFYETDVITFQYGNKSHIKGEVFICPDVVFENAADLSVSEQEELNRVVLHGLLHLMDYNDQTEEEKAAMRRKEEDYLKFWNSL